MQTAKFNFYLKAHVVKLVDTQVLGTCSQEWGFESLHGHQYWGISSDGRAPDLHSGGHQFDPGILHQTIGEHYEVA